MKNYISISLLAVGVMLFASCEQDVEKQPEPEIRPAKMQEDGYVRELQYRNDGKLVAVKSTSTMPDKTLIESVQTMEYDQHGRWISTSIDDNWRMEYTYSGDRIVRTDEYRNTQPHQVHLFRYNLAGRMVEMLTFRLEDDEKIPVSKTSNVYDLEGNIMTSANYNYEDGEYVLSTTFTYSDYDDMKSNQHFFAAHALNPLIRFHTNNPGKMVVKNFNGVITSTEDYTYQYNFQEYPMERYTTVTFPYNGNTGIYRTEFFYIEE